MSINKFVNDPKQMIKSVQLKRPPHILLKRSLKIIIFLNHIYYGAPSLGW